MHAERSILFARATANQWPDDDADEAVDVLHRLLYLLFERDPVREGANCVVVFVLYSLSSCAVWASHHAASCAHMGTVHP